MMLRCSSIIAFVLTVTAVAGFGEVQIWQVGEGGATWGSHSLIEAAVDLSSGYVQPSGFTKEDNIVASLSWVDVGGTPNNFTAEGQARVWSNVAGKLAGEDLTMVDGDSSSSTGDRFKPLRVNQAGRTFTFDLGASFPANKLVFYPSAAGLDFFMRAFVIKINDGRDFDSNGRQKYVLLRREELNNEPRVEINFPKQQLRYIELRNLSPNPFEIAEIEVYGEGFVPKAQYLSDYIDFGDAVNFGELHLEAERISEIAGGEAEASVTLEVRNGTDTTPQIYYEIDLETQAETEISVDTYNKLEARKRTVRYDSENWSAWSSPLTMSGDGEFEMDLEFLPGPRQFFQFRLFYLGTASEMMRVLSLEFTHSQPLARIGLAEVALEEELHPAGAVASTITGEKASFVYGIMAEPGSGDSGFDGIRIETPEKPEFLSFSVGELDNEVEPDSLHFDEDGLRVYFPSRRVNPGDRVPIWITFETTPLLYSTFFRGWLLDTKGDLPQPLSAGDVGPEIGTNSLLIFGSFGQSLGRFELSSGAVTPNGDGVNDAVDILYDLVFLVEEAGVTLNIFDLSGRPVRELFAGSRPAGRFAEPWNGADDGGKLVPPGNYICAISVETQNRTFEKLKVLAVVY
jgi:hypothetical protein